MRTFSIRQLECFSEIKSHTLRMWEKRYAVLKPERTDGNARVYSFADLKMLLNISVLNKVGVKISSLSRMCCETLEQKIAGHRIQEIKKLHALNRLILSMYSSVEELEVLLDECVKVYGIHDTITLIMEFLEKVDLLAYNTGSSEIHFSVTNVRRKIISGIEMVATPPADAPRALLFLPKSEHYDLVLLYINYELKRHGIKVLYLGTNISLETLKQVAIEKKPDYLITYNTPQHPFEEAAFVSFLAERLPIARLFITSRGKGAQASAANVTVLHYRELLGILQPTSSGNQTLWSSFVES